MNVESALTSRVASRVFSGGLALTTGVVLGVARYLEPSPLGHSTHLQLGLGTCTFLTLTGIPCPMCGCTTTFSLWAHFHPIKGFVNQPFGSVLFVLTAAAFGLSIAELVHPRDRWSRLADQVAPYETHLATAFLVSMTAGWLYKIALMVLWA